MKRLFDIEEGIGNESNQISDEFLIKTNSSANYKILRLIAGSTNVTNKFTRDNFSLSKNYLGLFYHIDESKSLEQNIAEILGENTTVEDLKTFLFDQRFIRRNSDFFSDLENEFCNFLIYQHKGSYTTAFVFLYRILEFVSLSFPLIYASNTYDFKHTYGSLKDIFDGNVGGSKGELGFFKSAINVMFKDSDLMQVYIDINLEGIPNNDIVYKSISNLFKNDFFHDDTVENSKISINFGEVSSFIITIRNRFFHFFNRGDKNLQSTDVIDSDYFFSIINEALFLWICVVFIEINKFLLEEYERYK